MAEDQSTQKAVGNPGHSAKLDTTNEFMIGAGENLPNHSASLAGRGKFVRQSVNDIPTFRTRQAAYRYAAWLITLAENWLPDEETALPCEFGDVLEAVRS